MNHMAEKRVAKHLVFLRAEHKGVPGIIDKHRGHAQCGLFARVLSHEQNDEVFLEPLKREVALLVGQVRIFAAKDFTDHARKLVLMQSKQGLLLLPAHGTAIRLFEHKPKHHDCRGGKNPETHPVLSRFVG